MASPLHTTAFAPKIAPVLLRILKLLATGLQPPEGFNYGSLFLIPKDDSLLIDHTRPILVANADNRIIAKLLANLLGPELNKILHASQKGFIPGRCGLEHIHALTASFYGAVEEGDQLYVLFLDTKKAFNSVDHRFVHKMLKKIGLPGWMRNTIHGLMTNVKVRPVFATKAEHDISILRGVKQGCPLSPLLFALCYDMLLQQLAKKDDHDAYAFVGDLALDEASIRPILNALRTSQKFADFSGLGLNLDKQDGGNSGSQANHTDHGQATPVVPGKQGRRGSQIPRGSRGPGGHDHTHIPRRGRQVLRAGRTAPADHQGVYVKSAHPHLPYPSSSTSLIFT
jgi:hypothetical protein